MKLRKAKINDVEGIQKLINSFAAKGEMLPRALNDLYENLRDYFVVESKDKIIACGALHITWGDLAEVKGFAVAQDYHRQGLGTKILQACLKEAKEIGIKRVFALTYKPAFFERHGFRRIDKNDLPHKIWTECVNCPKFPNCDEICLIHDGGK